MQTVIRIPQNPVPSGELDRIRGDVEKTIGARSAQISPKTPLDEAAAPTRQLCLVGPQFAAKEAVKRSTKSPEVNSN